MLRWEMQIAAHEENANRSVVITGAARVRAEWNGVNVLVNAAGWFSLTLFEEVTYAQWREIIAVKRGFRA